MVLAVDIGNTNIVVGCFDEGGMKMLGRLATDRRATELEYTVQLRNLLKLNGMAPGQMEGAVLCSVVPMVGANMKLALEPFVGRNIVVVGPGIRTGLKINIDNPGALGADRVADAVAAINEYPLPLITVDMGTATTIGVVDETASFIGGMIVPGVKVSLNALSGGTSQLPHISLEPPKEPIGRNTVDCMRSGIVYHNAAGVDGMIARIEAQLGRKCTVVVTGGLAGAITPYCTHEMIYDPDLLLKGLMVIYRKNRRKS
ncbi:MAG: type III pantothenate kinase [Oscillospiraceae bacterium]|nr:type III pantothenate kinase [Oscillospiraceae bacterium]MBR2890031.1 type III pantothenate kinase [Oscillospiraceae bacterium]